MLYGKSIQIYSITRSFVYFVFMASTCESMKRVMNDGRMDGWMDGWMDGRTYVYMYVCMYDVCIVCECMCQSTYVHRVMTMHPKRK
jgi:hypothetical protein